MTFEPIEHEPDDYSEGGESGAGERPPWGGIRLTPAGRRFVGLDDPTEQLCVQLAEVTAQRDEWHRQNGQLRGERDAAIERAVKAEAESAECQAQLAETSADGARWQIRAETAERELAELRERIGEAEVEWYVRWFAGDGYHYELCLDEQDARESIPDGDETCEVVSRVVGEWKAVER